jgi:hypothetical protein
MHAGVTTRQKAAHVPTPVTIETCPASGASGTARRQTVINLVDDSCRDSLQTLAHLASDFRNSREPVVI